MSGFSNDVVYGSNVDFSGNAAVSGQVTTNGQLLIGASSGAAIRVGSLTSNNATITINTGPGTIDISSSGRVSVTAPGAYPYTVVVADYMIIVDTSAARTINLLASPTLGKTYTIKDSVGSASINNITVQGNGANIDGSSSYLINSNYGLITVIYNGTTWSIV